MHKKIFLSALLFLSPALFADVVLTPTNFQNLPGWDQANLVVSLQALQKSCQIILGQDDTIPTGTLVLPLTKNNWTPVCQAALKTQNNSDQAKAFFMQWFNPYIISDNNKTTGLFTGYYLPFIPASRVQTSAYNVPILARPNDLVTAKLGQFDQNLQGKKISGKVVSATLQPYNVTRQQIDNGALSEKSKIILWTKTKADRFFLQVQGSGIAKLPDGSKVMLGYDGDNGGKYYPIGRWLIEHGVMKAKEVTMQKIHHWLLDHPAQADDLMNLNESFVFFKILQGNAAIGTERAPLTAGYSLAIDNKVIPFGLPLWLNTEVPNANNPDNLQPFQRLMIAQDTGGAIKGAIRGDIFFGDGEQAESQAGYMKNPGQYWLLIPKNFTVKN